MGQKVEGKAQEAFAPLSPTKQYLAERRTARVARWEEVEELAQAGAGVRQIAREAGVSRKTVRRLIDAPLPPQNQVVHPRPGLSPFALIGEG